MALVAIKWLQFTQNYTLLVGKAFYDYEDGRQKFFVSIPIEHRSLTSAKKKNSIASTTWICLWKHCISVSDEYAILCKKKKCLMLQYIRMDVKLGSHWVRRRLEIPKTSRRAKIFSRHLVPISVRDGTKMKLKWNCIFSNFCAMKNWPCLRT